MITNTETEKFGSRISHDSVYKSLLKMKSILLSFLKCYAKNPALASLVPDHLLEFPSEFETRSGKQIISDIVWAAKKDDSDCLLYIDLEIQSKNDFFMPARLLQYTGAIYTKLVQTGQHPRKQLPPVIPVVIYNGERPWTAPASFEKLVPPISDDLFPFVPKFKYLLIDIQREIIKTEFKNEPASIIIQLEQAKSQDEAIAGIESILNLPEKEGSSDAFQLFLRYMLAKRSKKNWNEIQSLTTKEIFNMIKTEGLTWREYDEMQAMARGEARGILTGAYNTLLDNLRTLMETTSSTLDSAMDLLRVPAEKRPEIIAALS